jgi:hypothetical protein
MVGFGEESSEVLDLITGPKTPNILPFAFELDSLDERRTDKDVVQELVLSPERRREFVTGPGSSKVLVCCDNPMSAGEIKVPDGHGACFVKVEVDLATVFRPSEPFDPGRYNKDGSPMFT